MLDVAVPTTLENVEKADEVAIGVGAGIRQRIADTGLRPEVHYTPKLLGGKKRFQRCGIAKICFYESKLPMLGQQLQPARFDAWVVVGVEIVEPDYFIT